ncbi:HET-domain-containing protein [Stipitochalara longipes BDJ]|nr:HET-domain-containing protein [Stipitochalara longipes BDJ]
MRNLSHVREVSNVLRTPSYCSWSPQFAMLCNFCSDIDLDQLATVEGYKHHSSCADLFHSAQNGCESCQLILESQWVAAGGDLQQGYDIGSVETQIIARTMHQAPGDYEKIRFGQVARFHSHRSTLMTAYKSDENDDAPPKPPFLWSFLIVSANPDDQSSSYIKLRPLGQRTVDRWDHLVSGWLTECLAGHEDCAHQSSAKVVPPTRVIDVGQADGSTAPFLHVCRDEVQEWVTLSHCWGQNAPLKTTVESFSEHQRALPSSKLPKLFDDAVLITRKLGYRYLWIDSLCIIQDNKEDWVREASNMGNIYKHCVFMISADYCRDSQESILENHGTDKVEYVQQGCYSSKSGFHSVMYTCSGGPDDPPTSTVLGSWAWAHQEQVLSPRTLHWTPSQIKWVCRTMIRSEHNPSGAQQWPSQDPKYPYPTKTICLSQERFQRALETNYYDSLELWYHLVTQFCVRKITFEEDSFAAVSSLAKEVRRLSGHDYKAGLWAQDFHNGLLWSTNGRASTQQTYVAPSWSWASMKKGIALNSSCAGAVRAYTVKPIAKILETNLIYAKGDEFGSIISGKLRINAPSKAISSFEKNQIRYPPNKEDPLSSSQKLSAHKMISSTITVWLDSLPEEVGDEPGPSMVYLHPAESRAVLVRIASVDSNDTFDLDSNNFYHMRRKRKFQNQNWALILEPVAGDADEWKRIGIARIADTLIDGWESRDFTII